MSLYNRVINKGSPRSIYWLCKRPIILRSNQVEPSSGEVSILNPATYKKPEGGFPGYDRDDSEGPGFFEEKGMDLALGSSGEGAKRIFKFFEDAGDGPTTGGAVEEILRSTIKQYLLPNLSKQLSKIICEDLDYKELSNVTKSTVTQEKNKENKTSEKKTKRY